MMECRQTNKDPWIQKREIHSIRPCIISSSLRSSDGFFEGLGDYRNKLKGERGLIDHAPHLRSVQSPAGYPLAGCSPALPASVSPAQQYDRTFSLPCQGAFSPTSIVPSPTLPCYACLGLCVKPPSKTSRASAPDRFYCEATNPPSQIDFSMRQRIPLPIDFFMRQQAAATSEKL